MGLAEAQELERCQKFRDEALKRYAVVAVGAKGWQPLRIEEQSFYGAGQSNHLV